MGEKISAINLTEELYSAIKDFFIGEVCCGITDITVTFTAGDKFKISVEKIQ